ncbi:MAG: hypothetical protein ACREB8_11705 [Pseudolabrys sp.]
MKFKNLGYAAFIAATTVAMAIGSAGPSQAKHKMKMAAPAPQPVMCFNTGTPVCATKAGNKYTYANACWAASEGAKIVSNKACPPPKAMKAHKMGGKKMAKPAMKKAMKKKM